MIAPANSTPVGHLIPAHLESNDTADDRLAFQMRDLPRLLDPLHAENTDFAAADMASWLDRHRAALIKDPTRHYE